MFDFVLLGLLSCNWRVSGTKQAMGSNAQGNSDSAHMSLIVAGSHSHHNEANCMKGGEGGGGGKGGEGGGEGGGGGGGKKQPGRQLSELNHMSQLVQRVGG